MIKSFFLLIFIGILTFLVTCGGIALGYVSFGILTIIVVPGGLFILYKILRNILGVYVWRFIGMMFLFGIFISLFSSIFSGIFMRGLINTSNNLPHEFIYIISIALFLIPIAIHTYVFHFYRMKAQNETIAIGSVGGNISSIFGNIFRPFINFFRDIQKTPGETIQSNEETTFSGAPGVTEEKNIQAPEVSTKNSESDNLMNSLSQVDITNISGITFLPKAGKGFQVKTPNIKRLAIYITTKLAKTTFEAEELRGVYNHVVKNLQSNLSKTDYNIVQGKINEFVQSGGEVKIEKI